MRQYIKPETDIYLVEMLLLDGASEGVNPNRDDDDENGGSMASRGVFEDGFSQRNSNLWEE